jgi:hypothetical protein
VRVDAAQGGHQSSGRINVDQHQAIAREQISRVGQSAARPRNPDEQDRRHVLHRVPRAPAREASCADFGVGVWGFRFKRNNLVGVCGILMHSSLVAAVEGLPLGLASIKFWTRKKFKGCDALKRKINPTRVPIEKKESVRWLENVGRGRNLGN